MLSHNVAELLKSPPGTTREVAIEEASPQLGPELAPATLLRGRARLWRSGGGLIVDCEVRTSITLDCARCLKSFAREVTARFEEEFSPTVSVLTGAPLTPAEDDALRIDDRHVLDLTEAVRQYLLMSLPLKPVCTPSCRGLCPTCGADLNESACACAEEPTSGPLAGLASLLPPEQRSRRSSTG